MAARDGPLDFPCDVLLEQMYIRIRYLCGVLSLIASPPPKLLLPLLYGMIRFRLFLAFHSCDFRDFLPW